MAGSPDSLLFRRMVLSFHGAPDSTESLEVVAHFARLFNSELFGLFVEDAGLIEWLSSPLSRHFSRGMSEPAAPSPETLSHEFSAAASVARQRLLDAGFALGLTTRFEKTSTGAAALVTKALEAGDLLAMIEPADPLARTSYPFAAFRRLVETSAAPVLFVPHGAVVRQGPILSIAAEQDTASRETVDRIVRMLNEELVLLPKADLEQPPANAARERLIVLSREALADDIGRYATRLSERGVPVLILGRPRPARARDEKRPRESP